MALRREVKNIVKLFSDIEIKVREATSNDPWGAPTSLLSEIADATNNQRALSEIMQLLWKRIGENGKNWRHVYKSLIVLDYIVKAGNESVAEQCKENLFSIKTLEEFKFIDKLGKDQGINIREKSKQLVDLLKDDEKLNGERQRALKAKRMIHKNGGVSNTHFPKSKKFLSGLKRKDRKESVDGSNSPEMQSDGDQSSDSGSDGQIESEIEKSRPSTEVEEELQLQIALATSREDAGESNQAKPDESVSDTNMPVETPILLDLADTVTQNTKIDLLISEPCETSLVDPWSSAAIFEQSAESSHSYKNIDLFGDSCPIMSSSSFDPPRQELSMRPDFLQIGAHLVDLDNIVSSAESPEQTTNPFKPATGTSKNPFSQEKPKPKSINELRLDGTTFFDAPSFRTDVTSMTSGASQNPFSSWKRQVEVN